MARRIGFSRTKRVRRYWAGGRNNSPDVTSSWPQGAVPYGPVTRALGQAPASKSAFIQSAGPSFEQRQVPSEVMTAVSPSANRSVRIARTPAGFGESPSLPASTASTFLPGRRCSLTSVARVCLKLLPLRTRRPFKNIWKLLSAVTTQTADSSFRPAPTVNSRRKKRVSAGTLVLASPSGYQIQYASESSMSRPDTSRLREAS